MTLDSTNALWVGASTRVRQHAPADTPPVVIRRAVELVYERALDDAASALIARIPQTEGSNR